MNCSQSHVVINRDHQIALLRYAVYEYPIPEVIAAARYIRRRDRYENPAGRFECGRFCPDATENVAPGRYTNVTALRSATHCALMDGASPKLTRRIAQLLDIASRMQVQPARHYIGYWFDRLFDLTEEFYGPAEFPVGSSPHNAF